MSDERARADSETELERSDRRVEQALNHEKRGKRYRGNMEIAAALREYRLAQELYMHDADHERGARNITRIGKMIQNAAKPVKHRTSEAAPKCKQCSKKLRAYRWRNEPNANGRKWGQYGDGFVCNLTCGYKYAIRVLKLASERT